MKHIYLFLSLVLFFSTSVKAQSFEWANAILGVGSSSSNSITTDSDGNVYTTGSFRQTVDFDPGVNEEIFTAMENADMFVKKVNSNSELIWIKVMTGPGSCYGNSIKIDNFGDIYISGDFSDTVDFDPNNGITTVYTDEFKSTFLLKLSPNGNLIWIKTLTGSAYTHYNSLNLDKSNNIYMTGRYTGTVDFDLNGGVNNLTASSSAIFILKLNSNGDLIWVKNMENDELNNSLALVIDTLYNVYCVGKFTDTLDFNPGTGTFNLISAGVSSAFIQKLDSNGQFLWAKKIGGVGYTDATSIDTDLYQNIYISGNFGDTTDFDPSTAEYLIYSSASSSYVEKLNSNGEFSWVKINEGIANGNSHISAIDVDNYGQIYTTGFFSGNINFIDNNQLIGSIYGSMFLQKLNTNGDLIWLEKISDSSHCDPYSIHVDSQNRVYTTGHFHDVVDFNPFIGINNLTTMNDYANGFTLKLNDCNTNTIISSENNILSADLANATYQWIDCNTNTEIIGETNISFTPSENGSYACIINNGICSNTSECIEISTIGLTEQEQSIVKVYPNPNNGKFTINTTLNSNIKSIQILNSFGQFVHNIQPSDVSNEINIPNISNGLYILKVRLENGQSIHKNILIHK